MPNSCPKCGGVLVAIDLTLDGNDLTMRSCSRCDVRFWVNDGEDTDIIDLLGRDPLRQPALR